MNELRMKARHVNAVYMLCRKNEWFTCGSMRQYGKMFDMVDKGEAVHDIALVIWICSDDVPFEQIETALTEIANG